MGMCVCARARAPACVRACVCVCSASCPLWCIAVMVSLGALSLLAAKMCAIYKSVLVHVSNL